MRSQETSYVPNDLWILVVRGNEENFDYRPTRLKQLFRARVIHSQSQACLSHNLMSCKAAIVITISAQAIFPQIKETIRVAAETFKMERATLSAKGMEAIGMITCIQGV